MGQGKILREEIQSFKGYDIDIYVEEQNVNSLSEEMLDCVLEEGCYMKDVPQREGGVVTEIYYYRIESL